VHHATSLTVHPRINLQAGRHIRTQLHDWRISVVIEDVSTLLVHTGSMRTVSTCALMVTLGCSSPAGEQHNATGGSTSSTTSTGGADNGGASSGAGTSSGPVLGGTSSGGQGGVQSRGGATGTTTTTTTNTAGGAAAGGSGGASSCVQNLACKLAAPPTTGDIYQDCVDRINQFLTQCACLPALTRRTDGEACANQMAEYDASKNVAHSGYTDAICTPSGSQNECPGYSSVTQVIGMCMQQMWDEGPPPTTPCTGTCYETHGHYINMTAKTVTKVACGFYTTAAGKVWAVQNFSR